MLAAHTAFSPPPCPNRLRFCCLAWAVSARLHGRAGERNWRRGFGESISLVGGVPQVFPPSSWRASSMKRFLCTLMALGLFLGMAGQATGQPTYSFTTLDPPGSSSTEETVAHGINASGQIVGRYRDVAGYHGFLLDQGSYTTLDPPGTYYTETNGINAS